MSGNKKHRTHNRQGPQRHNQGFKCLNCGAYVDSSPAVSGVQNRNHCPYCLWSRHVDLQRAGDRLSACKGGMQPIGLTQKRGIDKYGKERGGELMLVHRCTQCDGISINRIAADDSDEGLISVFRASFDLDASTVERLEHEGIHLLKIEDTSLVERQLRGNTGN